MENLSRPSCWNASRYIRFAAYTILLNSTVGMNRHLKEYDRKRAIPRITNKVHKLPTEYNGEKCFSSPQSIIVRGGSVRQKFCFKPCQRETWMISQSVVLFGCSTQTLSGMAMALSGSSYLELSTLATELSQYSNRQMCLLYSHANHCLLSNESLVAYWNFPWHTLRLRAL